MLCVFHGITDESLHKRSCKLLGKVVAAVIDTTLGLFEVELCVVVVRFDTVVITPLEISRAVFTAECELAPPNLSFQLELN
jgi:hypothetical protein